MKLIFRKSGRYGSYRITIPKDIVEAIGWKKGMPLKIEITMKGNKKALLIYPEDNLLEEIRGILREIRK